MVLCVCRSVFFVCLLCVCSLLVLEMCDCGV